VDSTAILHTAIKQLNGAENKRASRLSDSSCHLCFAVIGIWTYKILWSINISISQRFYTLVLGEGDPFTQQLSLALPMYSPFSSQL